ncbi:hypothetical protein [Kitasatospora sp. NPDC004531]
MPSSSPVDPDDVLRARTKLLASGRLSYRDQVDAHRVLARVSPAAHLPRLVNALMLLAGNSYPPQSSAAGLALCEEAVTAARAVDPADPARTRLLFWALHSCQRHLYELDRRTEALAIRAELADIERARTTCSPDGIANGLHLWACGLAEDGRHTEAADALGEWAAGFPADHPYTEGVATSLVQRAATLAAAGRSDEALAVFGTFVGLEAEQAADDRGAMPSHFQALALHAELLDRHGHRERAAAERQSALAVLAGASPEWEPPRSSRTPLWPVLLSCSADRERPAADLPHPPPGAHSRHWSPAVRQRCFDGVATLRQQADALAERAAEDPGRHLPELVRLHRTLTARSAVRDARSSDPVPASVRPLLDEGVELARRLLRHDPTAGRRALAAALVDRSTFRAFTRERPAALDDFREALDHLAAPDRRY